MLSVKRLILQLPLLFLMMLLSARMVYAKPPPAKTEAVAGTETAECSESAKYESGEYESAELKEDGIATSALPDSEDPDVSAALPDREGMGMTPGESDGADAGSDNEEGVSDLSDYPDSKGADSGSGEALRGTEKTGSLIIYCNVKGSLGDLSRRFTYTLTLEGLEPDTEYEIFNEGGDTGRGFSGKGFESDSDGKALLHFCLGDENCIIIRELPFGTAFDVCEKANDHTPEYLVHEVKSIKKRGSGPAGADLSTGEIRMTYSGGNYTVDFNNSRELAPVTGLPDHGPAGETTQLITGFALISILIILCTKSRHMHINIDMLISDVLESSEQLKRSDIDGYKSRCDKYHCHKRRPDRCA